MPTYNKPSAWAKELGFFAGRKLKSNYAAALLGLPINTWYKRNIPPESKEARPALAAERSLMALMSEVLTPAQQKDAARVMLREAKACGLDISDDILADFEKSD